LAGNRNTSRGFEFQPVTADRWSDLEELFGERGACGGCWCMWWRLKRSQFELEKGEGNRKAMKAIVKSKEVPGILAYERGRPVGWCSVAPREIFPVLDRSRILKRVDERPVWSVVCFFVEKNCRNRGLSLELLRAAIRYVKKEGGKVLEGYPIEPKKDKVPDSFIWHGTASTFRKAGFVEVARRSETRPIMRLFV